MFVNREMFPVSTQPGPHRRTPPAVQRGAPRGRSARPCPRPRGRPRRDPRTLLSVRDRPWPGSGSRAPEVQSRKNFPTAAGGGGRAIRTVRGPFPRSACRWMHGHGSGPVVAPPSPRPRSGLRAPVSGPVHPERCGWSLRPRVDLKLRCRARPKPLARIWIMIRDGSRNVSGEAGTDTRRHP